MKVKEHASQKNAFKERIAQIYYTHGLFCASHPYAVIFATVIVFIFCCYPLLSYQVAGNAPLEYVTPISSFSTDGKHQDHDNGSYTPKWYNGQPVSYVQQIIVKSAVSPWSNYLIPSDAFRSPLSTVFPLTESVNNFQFNNGSHLISLSNVCFQISEISAKLQFHLSQYSCLIISPANIWSQDLMKFQADPNLIATVFKNGKKSRNYNFNINEIFFGVPWKETGLKKYYMRSRQRVITYAITIILKEYNHGYIEELKSYLKKIHDQNLNDLDDQNAIQIHYEMQSHVIEFIPLAVAYVILFLYIYFSVRKIEHVKSKWALAMSAVTTVVASLLMSVSLCARFGINFTLNGGEIFPYLVVIIGLENMLVLTNSIVSTPPYLDVKIRVAQGLSKEGWSITKNLLTELCILMIGFFTFVPAIQEFCLFAVVGFLTDFFLQLVFFSTMLSIDIRGMELSDIHKDGIYPLTSCPVAMQTPVFKCPATMSTRLPRSKSAPKLHFDSHSNVISCGTQGSYSSSRMLVPKRLKFIYFWARTRMVQRVFMIIMVIWISVVIYKFFLIDYLAQNVGKSFIPSNDSQDLNSKEKPAFLNSSKTKYLGEKILTKSDFLKHNSINDNTLSNEHWPTLFGLYNISIYGRYLTLLPPIKLSLYIKPEDALEQRHPEEVHISDKLKSLWSSDRSGSSQREDSFYGVAENMFHDATDNDFLLLCIIAVPSMILLIYVMYILYRCICNRNYAEWRSSWHKGIDYDDQYSQTVHVETLPKTLKGHIQEVECFAVSGSRIASSCLAGEIIIWDATTGECLTFIKKTDFREKDDFGNLSLSSVDIEREDYLRDKSLLLRRKSSSFVDHSFASDEIEDEKKSSFRELPDLSGTICTDFTNFNVEKKSSSKYIFDNFNLLLKKHQHGLKFNSDRDRLSMKDVSSKNNKKSKAHSRSLSMDQNSSFAMSFSRFGNSKPIVSTSQANNSSQIWCLDFENSLVVTGCADGNVEFWNADDGRLLFVNDAKSDGVTAVRIVGNIVVVARLSGTLDFILIEPVLSNHDDHDFSKLFNRGKRCHELSESENSCSFVLPENISCNIYYSFHAHQQPIRVMTVEGGRIVTGSNDKTLKVIRLEDGCCLFTLHGHSGAITAIHVDKLAPTAAASGSEDGSVCMWDLMTGTCIYQLNGHSSGAVLALLYTHTHVISSGTDNRICIWERQQGHLLHSLQLSQSYCNSIMMLTSNILVTAKQGSLLLWDINEGEPLRIVHLGNSDSFISVHQMKHLPAGVIVDYGQLLKVIPFPTMTERISRTK